MERSEPSLAPQWLRNTGSVTGSGNSSPHFASPSSHSDASSLANHTRNRTSKNTSASDSSRSTFLDRSSSSNSRRNSCNGFAKHAYSSFNRNHRDKDREKDKDRSSYGDSWDRDSADLLGNIFPTQAEKDTLRRSHSTLSRKPVEIFPQRVASDEKNCNNGNHNHANGGRGVGGSVHKAVFDKNFPSLGTDERQGVPDIGRVSSPGFSTAVQSLPAGNSSLSGGVGRTSALAELPVIMESGISGSFSVQQAALAAASLGSGPPSATAGLNMAEALTQAPARTHTDPQLSVKTQRLEELAIKQSRQLIPVTPSMLKASVNSDKSKPKTSPRTGEMNLLTKGGQPLSSSLVNANQPLRGGSVKYDAPKTSHGKFQVLKPVWENGVSSSSKDTSSPANNSNCRAGNAPVAVATPVASAPLRSPISQKLSSLERKVPALDLKSGPNLERRPSLSQVQSRNDFFNLLKKKTSVTSSNSDPGSNNFSPTNEKAGKAASEVLSAPASPHSIEDGAEVSGNGDGHEEIQVYPDGESSCQTEAVNLDEEEAAFLRSLGWEENGDDEGLTEEEINAFYAKCTEVRPSFKVCHGMQMKLSMLTESHSSSVGGVPSELSSSDT